jgi:hypothetical protein
MSKANRMMVEEKSCRHFGLSSWGSLTPYHKVPLFPFQLCSLLHRIFSLPVRKPNNIFWDLYFSFTVMLLTVRLSIDSRKLIGRLPAQGQKGISDCLTFIFIIIILWDYYLLFSDVIRPLLEGQSFLFFYWYIFMCWFGWPPHSWRLTRFQCFCWLQQKT